MIQNQTATFNGAQSLDGDYPYVDITWTTAFSSAGAYIIVDGPSAVLPVVCWVKSGSKTASGCRVLAADQFTGDFVLIAVPVS